MRRWRVTLGLLLSLAVLAPLLAPLSAAERVIDARMHHLRSGEAREWSEFAEVAESRELKLSFTVEATRKPQVLRLRHRDLKQLWRIELNGRPFAQLPRDENSMVTFHALPQEGFVAGANALRVFSTDKVSDDVLIGDARLLDEPVADVLSQATIDVRVVDVEGRPLPCRLTLVDAAGSLMTTSATSDDRLAVRPGIIYALDGHARFGAPEGTYKLHAGRGFEYSLATAELSLKSGQTAEPRFTLRREVPTDGWVACDTHVHTLTHSGHGDATIVERMITLAGEGIELPIATDHNVQIDYRDVMLRIGATTWFTPVVGNEVTTRVGHFNVFPLSSQGPVVDHRGLDWRAVGEAIRAVPGEKVIVLNHARDLHANFRPFDPRRHAAIAGEDLEDWPLPANAMEVVNSSATMSDGMRLFEDWLGLLNRGLAITPIGSSDSHDVARHFVGQGRTYIRADDGDVSRLDTAEACRSLRAGRVMSGLGLLCRTTIAEKFGPGDLAPQAGEYRVAVDVLGPDWVRADRVRLFVNGLLVEQAEIKPASDRELPLGVKWRGSWTLKSLKHDAHVVAIATGPGVKGLYWPVAKPYQATSVDWTPYVIGCSGAVRIDADGDGRFSSALEYAKRLVEKSAGNSRRLIDSLGPFDEAVAVQAASLLLRRGQAEFDATTAAAETGPAHVKRGLLGYWTARRVTP